MKSDVHEIGIASSILESVSTEMRRLPEVQVCAVGVRIGELLAIDKDGAGFRVRSTDARLGIRGRPARSGILATASEMFDMRPRFSRANLDLNCPKCGDSGTTFIGGTELDIAYLEVEDQCVKL
jgi:Zn finger protein HypA/HybF involved in hydrogenase expression